MCRFLSAKRRNTSHFYASKGKIPSIYFSFCTYLSLYILCIYHCIYLALLYLYISLPMYIHLCVSIYARMNISDHRTCFYVSPWKRDCKSRFRNPCYSVPGRGEAARPCDVFRSHADLPMSNAVLRMASAVSKRAGHLRGGGGVSLTNGAWTHLNVLENVLKIHPHDDHMHTHTYTHTHAHEHTHTRKRK